MIVKRESTSLSYIRLFLTLLTLGFCSSVIAHPVSHTDAWVKLSDSVHVRLNVFLDDVLRHQGQLASDSGFVGSDAIVEAIQKHSETLLMQLRMFDEQGRPLVGRVVKVPTWRSDLGMVDLSVDASLKLTWDLVYSPVDSGEKLRSVTFVHNFTHDSLPEPGELRLHLQVKSSGRRIDAVIPPARPYSVVVPTGRDDEVLPSDSELNGASSSILIGPAHVTHEFTAPLLLVSAAWPAAQQFRFGTGNSATEDPNYVLERAEVEEIRRQVSDWFLSNTTLQIDGRELTSSNVTVQFLPAARLVDDVSDEELMVVDTLPLHGTQLGIRILYPRGRSLKSVELIWRNSPGEFRDATIHVISSLGSTSQLVPFEEGTGDNGNVIDFQWTSERSLMDTTGRFEESRIVVESDRVITRVARFSGTIRTLASIACAFGFGIVLFTVWRRASVTGRAVFTLLFAAIFAGQWQYFASQSTVIDSVRSQELAQALLRSVYETFREVDEVMVVNRLEDSLQSEFAEDVYLGIVETLSQGDDPLIDIETVTVNSFDILESRSDDSLITANCQWTVSGIVRHWGHSHRRTLAVSGLIELIRTDLRWKISSLSQSEVVENAVDKSLSSSI